jgi:anti-sigma factor (TIGR02949 family)
MKSEYNCSQVKDRLSSYLDDALSARHAQAVRRHVEKCPGCATHAGELTRVRALVRAHGRMAAPADLPLRIRLRLSQANQIGFWSRLGVHVDNFLRPLAIPATAGLLATLLTFGVLIQAFMNPPALANDVSTVLVTPPRLRATPPITFTTTEDGIWVQTVVDPQGRVTDYHILNAPKDDPRMLSELRHVLVFTQFEPATVFGRPTSGQTIINFRRISVKG